MPAPGEVDKALDPMNVRLLGAPAEVTPPDGFMHFLQQPLRTFALRHGRMQVHLIRQPSFPSKPPIKA
jgi:hypothetical protein